MSKHKPIAALLFLLTTATLASACDPRTAVLDDVRRPNQLCTDLGDGHCPKPNPSDITS
jgi:hypothetical protein